MRKLYSIAGKRALDLVIAGCAALLLSPLLLLSAIAVRLTLGAPVIFRQVRPGRYGEPFTLCKLRTMTCHRDADGKLLPDEKRLTRLGRLLRSTSLDELPQLWNVLRGELSLVGPRPLLSEYWPRYTPEQRRRHDVRPGITGWAQIHGRQCLPFSRRFELDLWYVDNVSLLLDVKILVLSALRVVFGTGVIHGQNVAEVDDLGLASGAMIGDQASGLGETAR